MKSYLQILPRICASIILISMLFILKTSSCNASFVWIDKSGSLAGSRLTSITTHKQNPETIYIGSEGSLYRSEDSGNSWDRIFKVPGSKAVNIIAVDHKNPQIIYVATESGIFKSEDGGENWQSCPLGAGKDNVLTLAIDSGDSNSLYAGTKHDVFVSKDAGKNWTRSSSGLSALNIRTIAQNYIDHEIIFAAADNGLFKSEDSAATWKKVFSEDAVDYQESDEYIEEGLAIAPTWVSVDAFNPATVYFSTKRGVFKSEDSGDSWDRMTEAGLLNHDIKNLIPSYRSRSYIFAATEGGIFRFSEKENIWREFCNGLNSKDAAFVALNSDQNTLWLVTKNGAYKTKGDIYEIKELTTVDRARSLLQNFTNEPSYREIQEVAIRYAEVHPNKIAAWRAAAKTKAFLPKLSFSVDQDSSKGLHWDAGSNPDRWVIGPEDEKTGWDITCTWDLGDLIWNGDQTLIDVRSKLMVQLRDDVLDEVTHLYFARRKLQVELMQSPPKDTEEYIEKELRLQELTAGIDAMTGGYFTQETARKKQN